MNIANDLAKVIACVQSDWLKKRLNAEVEHVKCFKLHKT